MSKRRKARYSGIIGQPHVEGLMMNSGNKLAIVVRKSDRVIETVVKDVENNPNKVIKLIPFVRGVFALIQQLIIGFEAMEYTATVYAQDMPEKTGLDKVIHKLFGKHSDIIVAAMAAMLSLGLFFCAFFGFPILVNYILGKYIINDSVITIANGLAQLLVLFVALTLASLTKEVKRTMAYHGAEHKCVNCIESGRKPTMKRVRDASKYQKRCSSSFMWATLFLLVFLFIFVKIDSLPLRLLFRIVCVPVAASLVYEYMRIVSKFDNVFTKIMGIPIYIVQFFTVREPDDEMIEVAIKTMEAIFDWKQFLVEEFPDYYSPYDFGLESVEAKAKLSKIEQIKSAREDTKKYREKHKVEKEEAKQVKEALKKSREDLRALKHQEEKRKRMEEKNAVAAKSMDEILNLNDDEYVESILEETVPDEGGEYLSADDIIVDGFTEDEYIPEEVYEESSGLLEEQVQFAEQSEDVTEEFEEQSEEMTEEFEEQPEEFEEQPEEFEEIIEESEETVLEEEYEEGEDDMGAGVLKPSKIDYMDDYGFDPEDEEVPSDTMQFEPVDESMLEAEGVQEEDDEDGPMFNKDILSIPMPETLSTREVLPEGGVVSRIYNYEEDDNEINEEVSSEDYDFDNIIDENGRLTLKDTDAFNKKLDEEFEAIMRSLGLEDDL